MSSSIRCWPGRGARPRGFTLVELLVVIAIIGVLIALLLPAVQAARESARRAQCINHLKQLGLAAHAHHDVREAFPIGMLMKPGLSYTKTTFFLELLPYLEQRPLHELWDFDNQVANVVTRPLSATIIPGFLCPSDIFYENPFTLPGGPQAFPGQSAAGALGGLYSGTSYAGNYGEGSYYFKFSQFPVRPNGIFFMTGPDATLAGPPGVHALVANHRNLSPVAIQNITDGTSSTIMMGEKYHSDPYFDTWTSGNSGLKMHQVSAWAWSGGTKGSAMLFCSSAVPINKSVRYYTSVPNDIAAQDRRFNGWGSGHPGGVNFLMCDGSARFVSEQLDQVTLSRLSTREDGKVVENY